MPLSRRAVILTALLVPAAPALFQAQTPDTTTLSVPGLEQPVEIIRDHWGINHIYAETEHDLFFAQGYAAVKDRTFQFEMWRREATGTVAEILGPDYLQRDIGVRLHQFRGDMDAELSWYHPRGAAIVQAFVDGVNAFIAETERDPSLLPIEFQVLGLTPGRWTPAEVVSRHNGLLGNLTAEVRMAQAVRTLGGEGVKALSSFEGGDPVLDVDPAIDLDLITDEVIGLYLAFRSDVEFDRSHVVPEYRRPEEPEPAPVAALLDAPRPEDIGSNNWVVTGRLTQSRMPIMANDPHRAVTVPSLRYFVHLVGPGWNVVGGGEPVLPGVSIGHNEHGAWGLTIFGNDSEDLYVYDTNPANPNQYRYRGAWEDMRIVEDTVAVKGQAPVSVELKYTRHGPVLHEDTTNHKAYALRAAWMEIGSAPYLASLRMNQARTWEEFRDACTYARIPAENMVWADVTGHIGWQASGIQPLRPNWSGLVPVPGDGRYEWDGLLPITALPSDADPDEGFIATANNYLFPPDYPYEQALHFTWADPYRAARITEVLRQGRLHSVADMAALQSDALSIPARTLVPLLRDLDLPDEATSAARAALLDWDFVLAKDSVAAGVYEMWQRHLLANVDALLVPEAARPFLSLSMKKVVDVLWAPDGRFGERPLESRDALLVESLADAVAELTGKLGPDMSDWHWGQPDYHHAMLTHPLSGVVTEELQSRLDIGPLARGGDAYTPLATRTTDRQTSGGTFKIVADSSDWDNSLGLNSPGQSGDPDSPYYSNLFPLWANDRYFPVAYSRRAVESVAAERVVLQGNAPTASAAEDARP